MVNSSVGAVLPCC